VARRAELTSATKPAITGAEAEVPETVVHNTREE
jgi:hypothetical protein